MKFMKVGKCPHCGNQLVLVSRTIHVYTTAHDDPKSGTLCEGKLMLAHDLGPETEMSVCSVCETPEARYVKDSTTRSPRPLCPLGCS